jgi:hypothetical protein
MLANLSTEGTIMFSKSIRGKVSVKTLDSYRREGPFVSHTGIAAVEGNTMSSRRNGIMKIAVEW